MLGTAHRTAVAALAGALAATLAGAVVVAAPHAEAALAGPEVYLTFDRSSLRTNSGGSEMQVRIRTLNGGSITSATSHDGGSAARYPAYQGSNPPLAVMTVVDGAGADDLNPGAAKFSFGADFRLDQTSQGSSSDNGDNLIQRGLYGAPMQFKIELDDRRPLCRVKGNGGAVTVRSSRAVSTQTWHRATCARDGRTVVLKVKRLTDGAIWTTSASGFSGELRAPSRATPLSVGGKVDAQGEILRQSADQFNGRVDNAFLKIS
jgi:hypothetical protein